MSKMEYLRYIISFSTDIGWEDGKSKEQIRALFISFCFIFRIDADTRECNDTLWLIYHDANLTNLVDYEDYEAYMVELIV